MNATVSLGEYIGTPVPAARRGGVGPGILATDRACTEWLELELTESLIAQDVEKVIVSINRLESAGVKLSIDHFGTGYSNLALLKRFRVDTLKIDQRFVRNVLTDADDASIALAVISLAHSLRIRVLAERVETAQQCEFLRVNRCDEIQGHYFSKPVPAGDLAAMLQVGKHLAAADIAQQDTSLEPSRDGLRITENLMVLSALPHRDSRKQ